MISTCGFKVRAIYNTLLFLTRSVSSSLTTPSVSSVKKQTDTPAANGKLGALNTVVEPPPFSISTLPLEIRKRSKDLVLRAMVLDKGILGHVVIHKNDTVSVILA